MILDDTIAAISSAVGAGARMIVRVSGRDVGKILSKLEVPNNQNHPHPNPLPEYRARGQDEYMARGQEAKRISICFSKLTAPAWLYSFISPRSYTGEDLIELHIPGNPLLARMLLDEIISLGARPAEPGEFTARAYFNGRMDLSQAEGVASTIESTSAEHLSAAQRLLSGELSRRLRPAMATLAHTLALVEVGIDFSEEDVEFLSADQVRSQIDTLTLALDDLLKNSARFEKLSHEPTIALAGRPNAGKSTLLNALARTERAVVSPIAGTTRDILSATVILRRGVIRLLDAAGLDESPPRDVIETQMRDRSLREIQAADVVVRVREITDERPPLNLGREPDITVTTKIDLRPANIPGIAVSALTGKNLNALRDALDAAAFGSEAAGSSLALNGRHVRSIT
jgi:tRNA modification GTPase